MSPEFDSEVKVNGRQTDRQTGMLLVASTCYAQLFYSAACKK